MQLYGSYTSPFVRRVRVVAAELGLPCTLVDAFSDEGQRALRELTPIWKAPTVVVDGRVLWDSAVILDYLFARHGYGPFRETSDVTRFDEACLKAAVDEALGVFVKRFYLRRDGVDVDQVAYLVKDHDRGRSILAWIDGKVRGPWCTSEDGFGLAELALYTAVDWMTFREMTSLDAFPNLRAFMDAHAGRESLVATPPPR